MISRAVLILGLVVIPATVLGVDLAAMEAMIEALEKPSVEDNISTANCDGSLAARIGRELPRDFDSCQPERQSSLMSNGLYVNQEGVVKPLPVHAQSRALDAKVIVPLPVKEDVAPQPHAPFVIDLALPAAHPAVHVNHQSITATNAIPVQNIAPASAPAAQVKAQPRPASPTFGCPDFQTFAHRGSPDEAENSIEAVVHALQSGHNGAEIDAQQLQDGNWVVHHDLMLGRVSYGQSGLITNMQSYQWRQVRLKDRYGSETQTQAPFLDDLLSAYRKNAHVSQVLNIEIKGGLKSYSCNALAGLNKRVLSQLSQSQFVYSSRYIEHLTCLRTANPNVYLGVVVDPHPDSIDVDDASTLGRAMSWYDRSNGASASMNLYLKNNNREHLTRTSFADVRSLIGPYYGFHIDYQDYWTFAPRYAKAQGRLVLYQLDDDSGLVALLKDIKQQKKKLPDGVLVDSDLQQYCGLRSRK